MPRLRSMAEVATPRAERWAKQLVSHLGRRLAGSLDEVTGVGSLSGDGFGATLTPTTDTLVLEAWADDEEGMSRVTSVIGSHLERFAAASEELTVEWRAQP